MQTATQTLTLEGLNEQFNGLKAVVQDLRAKVDEWVMYGEPNRQINEWAANFDNVKAVVNGVRRDLDKIVEDKLVEFVSDSDIKKLWAKSGVGLKDIERDFNVSTTTAHRMANGQNKDVFERSKMKQYFLNKMRNA